MRAALGYPSMFTPQSQAHTYAPQHPRQHENTAMNTPSRPFTRNRHRAITCIPGFVDDLASYLGAYKLRVVPVIHGLGRHLRKPLPAWTQGDFARAEAWLNTAQPRTIEDAVAQLGAAR